MTYSQSAGHWKLYVNQKEVVSASGGTVQTIKVNHHADTTLKFLFIAGDTAFKTKLIVMDAQQKGIDTKEVQSNKPEVMFDVHELYTLANENAVSFYIVTIPADPAKAALVRVAPRLICNLQWTK